MNASSTDRTKPALTWSVFHSLLALVVLGLVLLALGHSKRVDEPNDLDVSAHDWVVAHRRAWPLVTTVFRAATRFGNPDEATLATALVAFGLYALGKKGVGRVRRSEALVWLGAILGGRFLSIGLKLVFRRERPPALDRLVFEDTYSFPSGHSVFAAVFFTMLAVELTRSLPRRWPWARAAAIAACVALALTVGASRVWLGVHYPTDVLGGLLLGAGWVLVVALVRRWTVARRRATGRRDGNVAVPEAR